MGAVLSVSGESMHFMLRAMFLLMFRGFPEVAKVVGEVPDGFPFGPTAKPVFADWLRLKVVAMVERSILVASSGVPFYWIPFRWSA